METAAPAPPAVAPPPAPPAITAESLRAFAGTHHGRQTLRAALGLWPDGGSPPPFALKHGPKTTEDLSLRLTDVEMQILVHSGRNATLWEGRELARSEVMRRLAWEGAVMRGLVPVDALKVA